MNDVIGSYLAQSLHDLCHSSDFRYAWVWRSHTPIQTKYQFSLLSMIKVNFQQLHYRNPDSYRSESNKMLRWGREIREKRKKWRKEWGMVRKDDSKEERRQRDMFWQYGCLFTSEIRHASDPHATYQTD